MKTANDNQQSEDYFLHRIKPDYQRDANILLATTGVLNSLSGMYTLVITDCVIEQEVFSSMNIQKCNYKVLVVNIAEEIVKIISCQGSPNQCFEYIICSFKQLLMEHEDKIYLKQHDELTLDYFLHTEI